VREWDGPCLFRPAVQLGQVRPEGVQHRPYPENRRPVADHVVQARRVAARFLGGGRCRFGLDRLFGQLDAQGDDGRAQQLARLLIGKVAALRALKARRLAGQLNREPVAALHTQALGVGLDGHPFGGDFIGKFGVRDADFKHG
jgi:hypothetical protein